MIYRNVRQCTLESGRTTRGMAMDKPLGKTDINIPDITVKISDTTFRDKWIFWIVGNILEIGVRI